MHNELAKLVEKYPSQLAIILLPVPLNKGCNPHLPDGVVDHEKACEFALLALRVWRTDPQQFAAFHEWLFTNGEAPVEVAEIMATELVGQQLLPSDDLWINAILEQNIMDYRLFSEKTPVMPKLAIKGSNLMQGTARDSGALEDELQKYLSLKK